MYCAIKLSRSTLKKWLSVFLASNLTVSPGLRYLEIENKGKLTKLTVE